MILNVAANNGNTTMTTQKQFEKFYEQRNNFSKRKKKSLKKCLKNASDCDILDELSLRQTTQRTLIIEQYNQP